MIIVGAGLAGLIAATQFSNAKVFEAGKEDAFPHSALLRFRTPIIGQMTGVPFKEVSVRKGISVEGKFVNPSIRIANDYSKKVTGKIFDRSIWNIETATRYIAPEDFPGILKEMNRHRVEYESPFDYLDDQNCPIISTAPLHIPVEALNLISPREVEFERSPINVRRYRITGANVHQTIYYPGIETHVYRASITGDLLIIEAIGSIYGNDIIQVANSFGLTLNDIEPIGDVKQAYGKIAPIDETLRRALVRQLSGNFNIYSLGRFATWRNLLLDDLPQDINVIRRLINNDSYHLALKG